MTGTMAELMVAGLFLLASHFGLSSTPLRPALIRMLGEGPYRGLYSLIALVALVWLTLAYRAAPPGAQLWSLGMAGPIIAVVLLPIALVLLVAGVSMPNPTAIGGERHLERKPAGVLRITRNPVMWAIGLWGIAHLLANGDASSVIFFGSLTVLAILGSFLIDAKNRQNQAARFAPFELSTSNLPFGAILQGRQSLGAALAEIGLVRLLVAVLLYAALLLVHPWLFGVQPYP